MRLSAKEMAAEGRADRGSRACGAVRRFFQDYKQLEGKAMEVDEIMRQRGFKSA